MVRVLVTRPEPGASRTVKALNSKGIHARAICLTEILPLQFKLPAGNFDALIITSQNAIIHGAALLEDHKSAPVFAVGKRTAESLPDNRIIDWAETAEGLLPKIINRAPKRLLYICGQTRRPELEAGLKNTGIKVDVVEVYSAKPAGNASEKLEKFFQSLESTIVLFHAPSAANIFVSAINRKSLAETTRFLCLSAAIAADLPAEWQNQITVAKHPDEATLLHELDGLSDKMLARDHMPEA